VRCDGKERVGELVSLELDTAPSLYQRAIAAWGEERQMRKLQEECGEVTAATNRWYEHTGSTDSLAEEIADVEIMCEQARLIVGTARVEHFRKLKLERLADRVRAAEVKS
jgi:NTP pyrophosphatase (non-canonical NTP hydrolase)